MKIKIMKIASLKISVLFLIVSTMISCSEDDSPAYRVSAKRNDVDWNGYSEIHFDDSTDTLTLLAIANQRDSGVVVLKIKFDGTGSYSLTKKQQGYYYTTIGGDVTASEYFLAPNTTGAFVISKYDQKRGFIEGSFEMSLKKERSLPGNNIDIYNFTQGTFRGKIRN